MKIRKKIRIVLAVFGFCVLFWGLQRLVCPKYASGVVEGNFTAEYYQETLEHDVLLVGDCEVYENIDPMYLWKNYGITSYIRGNAQQLAWHSYYLLEEALKKETPKVVIYNVQALSHGDPQKEEYNRMVLDGMRWSKSKLEAVRVSMCPGESLTEYLFPLLRYHSRILDLTAEDAQYFFQRKQVTHNGYYMRVDVLPVSASDVADTDWIYGDAKQEEVTEDPWADIETEIDEEVDDSLDVQENEDLTFQKLPMQYLNRMRLLCEKKDITFLLMKAPSAAPQWYTEQEEQVQEYAQKYDLPYLNFYDLLDETAIDYETDTYDGGLHMNLSGADKLSKYLGNVLQKQYGVPDRREDSRYAKVYKEKYSAYCAHKKKQQEDLKQYGKIRE